LFYYWPLLRTNNMATNLQRLTSSCGRSVLPRVTVERRHLGRYRYMQRVTAADTISHVLLYYVKRNIAANKAHILQPMSSLRCATTIRPLSQWNLILAHLQHSKTLGKHETKRTYLN